MTRRELVDRLCADAEGTLSRTRASELIERMFEHIADTLVEQGRFSQPGFGTFSVQVRGAHPGKNPRTGETIQIPETSTVRFKPADKLRARLRA
jgi:nucleoid DNA-binding protein